MDQEQQLIEKLQSATNILVTVSNDPSVDQLAACVALTLALNKTGKHATAVFSGTIPETIEFLKPEETLEKNTDSLRDFIIALDKTKADKLRYKVEDQVVKIFITPYRTSIGEEDLEFSQGDFNVDAVVALGVHEQKDIDQAITAHGRILHDATVLGIHNKQGPDLGSINWVDDTASSLSELVAGLVKQLDKKLVDEQIATALLTGIVAETDRFRNENTTAQTMSISAELMAAGANQQLVTSQLEHAVEVQDSPRGEGDQSKHSNKHKKGKKAEAGTLEINHQTEEDQPADDANQDNNSGDTSFDTSKFDTQEPEAQLPPVQSEQALPTLPEAQPQAEPSQQPEEHRDVMTDAPRFDTPLTANDKQETEQFQPSVEMSDQPSANSPTPASDDVLRHLTQPAGEPLPTTLVSQPTVPPIEQPVPGLEPTIDVPPPSAASTVPTVDVDAARNEVMKALSEQPDETLPPVAALNAQPLGNDLHTTAAPMPSAPAQPTVGDLPALTPVNNDVPPASHSPADQPMDMPLPPSGGLQFAAPPQASSATDSNSSASAPPPVPPPMTPPAWPGPQQ